ncbi:hypothetical protein [Chromohalobacter canadensis]|uniref:hypothetical protein n=1 Tax=Chromohalobacter canadensis TaxID=141389 RepID=UPI002410A172|nr:hypothetical protein [Chromohalobacter canadensis]
MVPEDIAHYFGAGLSPVTVLSIQAEKATTYREFVSAVSGVMEIASATLRGNSEFISARKQREDYLSSQVIAVVKSHGLNALPAHHRGNTDISITDLHCRGFRVICEAKILGGENNYGNDHVYGGLEQLCTRYDTGDRLNHYSFLLIYNYKNKTSRRLGQWLDYMFLHANDDDFEGLSRCSYLGVDATYGVHSTHIHCDTGEQVYVQHLPVSLHYNPKS